MSFLQDARRLLDEGTGWAGLAGDALGFVLGDVAATGRWLVVCDEPDAAERVLQAIRFFHPTPGRVLRFPADDVRPYDGFSPHPDLPRERLRTLRRLEGKGDFIVVAPSAALMQLVPNKATRRAGTRTLAVGEIIDRDVLIRWLSDAGYLAVGSVSENGCFAVRGDILDVWPAGAQSPIRIDFFDDEIEDMRFLDPASQHTGAKRARVALLPAREERVDTEALNRLRTEVGRYATEQKRGREMRRRVIEELRSGIRFSAVEAWLPALVETSAPIDALGDMRMIVVLPEDVAASVREFSRQTQSRWEALEEDERPLVPPDARYVNATVMLDQLASGHPVFEYATPGESVDLGTRPVAGFGVRATELGPVVRKIEELAKSGVRVALIAPEGNRVEMLLEMIGNHGLHPKIAGSPWDLPTEDVSLLVGELSRGFLAPDAGYAFVPATALFGNKRSVRNKGVLNTFFDVAVSSVSQLKDGDFVVHRVHGIGLYRGLHRLPIHGTEQDFVALEYRGGDRMYLPVTALSHLSQYSPARSQPKVMLDRLGGLTWSKRTGKVRDSVLKMAQELLQIYAKRELAERPAYEPPGSLSMGFAARFPYEETPDQATAIAAIYEDLESDTPMDRLICGDVGFGKTEVAMRAAIRAVEAGKQVALLCPTTVLAFQHLRTFRERVGDLPVRVEMLSRFLSKKEEKVVIADTRAGKVDILVGTTKILGRGVKFSDLGLLIVDEEHRFGVKQKENMKKLRSEVDVLSMSATPIPRTLEMALSGIREMSIIATPPAERLAVRTSVARFGKTRVRDAIMFELARKGQCYFVHNRVQTIEDTAEGLRKWIPEATFAVAHGQMSTDKLEQVLVEFIDGKFDVLVCSAIIESGIDLPNVNTMVVNRADMFGLAQLYQLRGRVGRAAVRGNCLLLTPEEMSKDARKRMRVILEANRLGAGFQVASADLELRGGGNLVGDAQTGNIDAVGYEMWLELLAEAVDEARGIQDRHRIDPEVSVPMPAFIPENYVRDVPDRLGWYRRLSTATTPEAVDGLVSELESLYGVAPPEINNLAGLSQTRIYCQNQGFVRLNWLKVRVVMEVHEHAHEAKAAAERLVSEQPKRFELTDRDGALMFTVRFTPNESRRPFRFLRWLFVQLKKTESGA